jgi:hypothetical protein
MNKLNLRFEYEPEEEEELSRDEIADRLGDEMIEQLEDMVLLCQRYTAPYS